MSAVDVSHNVVMTQAGPVQIHSSPAKPGLTPTQDKMFQKLQVEGNILLHFDDFETDGCAAANGLYYCKPGSVKHYMIQTPKDTDQLIVDKRDQFRAMCHREWDAFFNVDNVDRKTFTDKLAQDISTMPHTGNRIHLVVSAPIGLLLQWALEVALAKTPNVTVWMYTGEYNCQAAKNPLLSQIPGVASRCTFVDVNRFKCLSGDNKSSASKTGSSVDVIDMNAVQRAVPGIKAAMKKYCLRFNIGINCRPSRFIANYEQLPAAQRAHIESVYENMMQAPTLDCTPYFTACLQACRAYWPDEIKNDPASDPLDRTTHEAVQRALTDQMTDGPPSPYIKAKKSGSMRPGAVEHEFPMADFTIPVLMWIAKQRDPSLLNPGTGGWGHTTRGHTGTNYAVDATHPVAHQPYILHGSKGSARDLFVYLCTMFMVPPPQQHTLRHILCPLAAAAGLDHVLP